ncbi:neurochondrin-like isoform X4 [Oscarella lobularis]|uniref:neurochondrin-like isoform X4 n=1 Tax=Oscarella lobularis TaxID=121494 RepID=UPI0033130BCC
MAAASDLERCLRLLNSSTSDNEVFAGLLLVTRIAKANELNAETRRRIFDAVGFKFLDRLLNTDVAPEGCAAHVFRSLALSVLSCFATDKDLVTSPQMIEKIPLFCEIVSLAVERSDSDLVSMAGDCLECLVAMSLETKTRMELIQRGAVPCLVKRACNGCDVSLGILIRLASSEEEEASRLYSNHSSVILELINHLAVKFKEDQTVAKFDLCDHLTILLQQQLILSLPITDPWPSNIKHALDSIFRSKIAGVYCRRALALASSVTNCLGLDWTITRREKTDDEFFKLLFYRTSVETRMILDGKCVEELLERDKEASILYSLLEHYVTFLVTMENALIGAETIGQIHTGLRDCLADVVAFLADVDSSDSRDAMMESPLVSMSVRLLGSWIAEETVALQESVIALIPFLVELGKKSLIDTRFLLPGLCHLSADDKARKRLVETDCLDMLVTYFYHASDSLEKSNETEASLVTCCGVLLNFCVLEAALVADGDQFARLLERIQHLLPMLNNEHPVLRANCVTLSTMILRHRHHYREEKRLLFDLIVEFIGSACEFDAEKCALSARVASFWSDIEELWFLAGKVSKRRRGFELLLGH